MTVREKQERIRIAKNLLKNSTHDVGSRTLAKQLLSDHPHLWNNLESARGTIRVLRGAQGPVHLKFTMKKSPETIRPKRKPGDCAPPKSRQAVPKPWRDNTVGNWGVISDVHAPFHDHKALEAAVRNLHKRNCGLLFMNGDIVDLFHFSRWFSDPIYGSPKEHYHQQLAVLDWISSHFDRVVYKLGNHEKRYKDWLGTRAREVADLPPFEFNEFLCLKDYNIHEVLLENQIAYLGKCPVLHGHELAKGFVAPVNPARGAYLKVRDSVVIGHHHRSSTHQERTGIGGKIVICRSVGCLCQLQATYQLATNWNHGYAIVEVDSSKNYEFSNFALDDTYREYRA